MAEAKAEVGYDTNTFVEKPPGDFICGVCLGVARDACETECGHIFCQKCIALWMKRSRTCPVDRSQLNSSARPSTYIQRKVMSLEMQCSCGVKHLVNELANHTKRCRDGAVACNVCGEVVKRSTLTGHHKKETEKHMTLLGKENEKLKDENRATNARVVVLENEVYALNKKIRNLEKEQKQEPEIEAVLLIEQTCTLVMYDQGAGVFESEPHPHTTHVRLRRTKSGWVIEHINTPTLDPFSCAAIEPFSGATIEPFSGATIEPFSGATTVWTNPSEALQPPRRGWIHFQQPQLQQPQLQPPQLHPHQLQPHQLQPHQLQQSPFAYPSRGSRKQRARPQQRNRPQQRDHPRQNLGPSPHIVHIF